MHSTTWGVNKNTNIQLENQSQIMKPNYTMALNHYGLGRIKDLDKDLELGVALAIRSLLLFNIHEN